jgi:cytoskeletal protein CcmA (bactofilin family)
MNYKINLKRLHDLKHKHCLCDITKNLSISNQCPCDIFTITGKCKCGIFIEVKDE